MKKNTALTFGAIALLSAGVTFGVKFKQKKDFEKTLKTILIPDAEEQLDSLLRKDAALKDSVDFYRALLLMQSSVADGQSKADEYNKLLGTNTLNIYSELHEISKILGLMENDWAGKYFEVLKRLRPYHIGEGEYDDNETVRKIHQEEGYLLGMTKSLADDDKEIADIPGGYQRWVGNRYNDVYPSFFDGNSFDYYVNVLRSEIKATKGKYNAGEGIVYYPIVSATEIKELLMAIEYFANNFENTRGVVNPKYVQQINKLVAELLPKVEKQIRLEAEKEKTAKKLTEFESAKGAVEKSIKQQRKKLDVLQHTEVSKLMREQRNK